jgi:hypothetical protein
MNIQHITPELTDFFSIIDSHLILYLNYILVGLTSVSIVLIYRDSNLSILVMVLDIGTMLVTKVNFNIHFFCEKQSSAVSLDTFCNKRLPIHKN